MECPQLGLSLLQNTLSDYCRGNRNGGWGAGAEVGVGKEGQGDSCISYSYSCERGSLARIALTDNCLSFNMRGNLGTRPVRISVEVACICACLRLSVRVYTTVCAALSRMVLEEGVEGIIF